MTHDTKNLLEEDPHTPATRGTILGTFNKHKHTSSSLALRPFKTFLTKHILILDFCFSWTRPRLLDKFMSQTPSWGHEMWSKYRLHPHVLNVLCMQMRSCLHMQSSHVPQTALS